MKKWILFSLITCVLVSCEKEKRECPGAVGKTFTQTDFTRIKAGNDFTFSIVKGSTYNITATGCQNDLDDLNVILSAGNTLEIDYENYRPGRYQVDFTITTPVMNALILSGNAAASVTGFQDQTSVIRTILSGNSKLTMNGTPVNANVELSGNSLLNISGSTVSLYGDISGNSTLNAYPLNATEVDILTSGNARAFVTPVEKLFVSASGQSIVRYKGDPAHKNIVTSGNGKVIKE